MPFYLFIIVFLLNLCSWLVFFFIHKNVKHVTNGHVRILGIENKELVKTRGLFVVRFFYGSVIVFLSVLSYFIFSPYFS